MEKSKGYDDIIGCAIVGTTTLLYSDDILTSYASCTIYVFLMLLFCLVYIA